MSIELQVAVEVQQIITRIMAGENTAEVLEQYPVTVKAMISKMPEGKEEDQVAVLCAALTEYCQILAVEGPRILTQVFRKHGVIPSPNLDEDRVKKQYGLHQWIKPKKKKTVQ